MKTVLITGIGKGIGRALAEIFLDEGFAVLGTYLSGTPTLAHKNLTVYKLNLSSSKSIEQCSQEIQQTKKKINILINCAGVLLDENETCIIVDALRKTLEVNLIGTVDFTERIIPYLAKDAHIVNISSTAGSLTLAGKGISHFPYHYPAYKISKTALNMYTVTLATHVKKAGITVSSVHPGWVKTDMGGQEAELSPEKAAQQIYDFAITHPETGKFWYAGKQLPW